MTEPAASPPPPSPPYPAVALTESLFLKVLKEFEEGRLSVAGALQAAIMTAWALGHAEGEDSCLGCTHRVLQVPKTKVLHLHCIQKSAQLISTSMDEYIRTWRSALSLGLKPNTPQALEEFLVSMKPVIDRMPSIVAEKYRERGLIP